MNYLSDRIQEGVRAAQLGLLCNAVLVTVKVVTGILGNSYALIADGVESGADVLFSAIVWKGLRVSEREANREYNFGYGKAEPLAAVIVAFLLIGAAIAVAVAAIQEIRTPHHLPELFTLPVLAAVIVIKEWLFRRVLSVGESVESLSVKGDAWHHRADALTSLAAFVGILVALIGGPGWEAADDYAALLCAFVIAWNGISMARSAAAELMDKAPEEGIVKQVIAAAASVEGVELIEKVMARKSGLSYFVALHVHADPKMSLYDAHIVSGKVKTSVKRAIPSVKDVLVHMEPTEAPEE